MSHFTTPDFWAHYSRLSPEIQALADEAFARLNENPQHPSLHFKKAGEYWSVRVGRHHRALAVEDPDGLLWTWIGRHSEYERKIRE